MWEEGEKGAKRVLQNKSKVLPKEISFGPGLSEKISSMPQVRKN